MNTERYKINNNNLIIKDQKSAKFHIKEGDYFGTIATTLSLLSQEDVISDIKKIKKYLKRMSKDLDYLQKNFKIVKKP
ncbi:MAG: hypothetical protein WC280_02615 [Patescibacteria group bacterium]